MDREELLKKQFVREARIGLTLIGITFAAFVVIAYSKLTQSSGIGEDNLAAQESSQQATTSSATQITPKALQAQLNASTISVLDQVEANVGDTSPTKSPPMPTPRTFLAPVIPATDSHETNIPASDSSLQKDESRQATANASPSGLTDVDSLSVAPAKSPTPIKKDREQALGLSANQPLPQAPIQNEASQFPIRHVSISEIDSNTVPKLNEDAKPATMQIDNHSSNTDADSDWNPAEQLSPQSLTAANLTDNSAETKEDEDVLVQVKAGESLWTLAQRHYGDGRLFRALAAYNQLDQSTSGRPEDDGTLRLPTPQKLRAAFPHLMPNSSVMNRQDGPMRSNGPTYFTQPGDTLFDIARDHLGQASRYVELISLNCEVLPANVTASSKLPSGIRLRLGKE